MAGIKEVADKAGVKESVVKDVLAVIVNLTGAGEVVQLRKFGTFRVKHRPARTGRNIGTGETISIPEKSVLTFKASK